MYNGIRYFSIMILATLLASNLQALAETQPAASSQTPPPVTQATQSNPAPVTTNVSVPLTSPATGSPAASQVQVAAPQVSTTSPSLQGQIQQNQIQQTQPQPANTQANSVEALFSQIIGVTKIPVTLQGDLAKNYSAMHITLKNNQPTHISILQGEVLNAVDENAAVSQIYQEQYNKAAKRQRGASIFGGLLSTAASFIPYAGGVAGYATSAGLGAAADVAGAVGSVGGPDGYPAVSGQYIRQIKEVIISPGDVYQFSTLMPRGMAPQLKLIVKNLQSNEIVTMQR